MKEIVETYKEQVKYFISNKRYMVTMIIVAILSYGFTITHYSIGMDDLCFDRYVHGTYLLSAKRWGTWLLYNVLQINEFTPFWLDAVVVIFMVIIAIVLSAFIRKQYGNKIKLWSYILFSCLLISNPIINLFFMFQSTNLAIVISNLLVIICGIVIFENYFNQNKKRINIICGLILTIPIAMYESCAQTYLVFLFITMYIKFTQSEVPNKKIWKYFCLSICMLILGIGMYFIIGKCVLIILERFNMLNKNFAYPSIWGNKEIQNSDLYVKMTLFKMIVKKIAKECMSYGPAIIFIILSLVTIVIEIVRGIKARKLSRIICVLGLIFSNFILMILLDTALFRAQFSWVVTFAFLGLYIYQHMCNKKVIKYFINVAVVLLIIFQTRTLNQYFYNDYKRYENEKVMANEIAINVMKNCDYKNKPLCYVTSKGKGEKYKKDWDNSLSVIQWGVTVFEDHGIETTKFINEQGYHFKYMTQEEAEKANEKYEELDAETKNKSIIELEDIIIVNLNVYDF